MRQKPVFTFCIRELMLGQNYSFIPTVVYGMLCKIFIKKTASRTVSECLVSKQKVHQVAFSTTPSLTHRLFRQNNLQKFIYNKTFIFLAPFLQHIFSLGRLFIGLSWVLNGTDKNCLLGHAWQTFGKNQPHFKRCNLLLLLFLWTYYVERRTFIKTCLIFLCRSEPARPKQLVSEPCQRQERLSI